MRVLITGGAGFIGTHLAETLAARGDSVRVLDNLSAQIHPGGDFSARLIQVAECRRGSVADAAAVAAALDGVEAVVHLAAETGTAQSMYTAALYSHSNVVGTATLLDAIVNGRTAVRRLVLASSRAVYGEGQYECPDHGVVHPGPRRPADLARQDWAVRCPLCGGGVRAVPTREDALLSPASVYASNKQSQEQLVGIVAAAVGLEAVVLRFQNVFGPGQSLANPYTGVICTFYNQVLAGSTLNLYEDGDIRRDFVYVDDVVAATAAALLVPAAAETVPIINVGSGRATSISEVASLLFEITGHEPAVAVSGNFRVGDIRACHADLGRLKSILALEPTVELSDGLRRFAGWAATDPGFQAGVVAANRAAEELRARNLLR